MVKILLRVVTTECVHGVGGSADLGSPAFWLQLRQAETPVVPMTERPRGRGYAGDPRAYRLQTVLAAVGHSG
jgi:hypothetical protein